MAAVVLLAAQLAATTTSLTSLNTTTCSTVCLDSCAGHARDGHEGARSVAAFCEGPFFTGMKDGDRDPKADWAGTYAENTPLAFRFDGCGGHWHRPGARMSYAEVLKEMNVTHHLKITA